MTSSRDRFDDFFDDDEDENVVDTRPDGRLMRVPLSRIAPNQVNPRSYFGTEDDLRELGNSLRRRQVHAIPAVSRSAYLRLWPEHEAQVGLVDVVIVSGERRYRAAQTVGLPGLHVVIDDAVAESRQTFLNAVVTENVARENFDPIEEALALESLVAEYGTAAAVAEHFDKSNGWVSQRRLLLRLSPDMQMLARRREIPVEAARTLAGLVKKHGWTAEEQGAWWVEQQRARAAAAEEATARRQVRRPVRQAQPPAPEPTGSASVFTAVNTDEDAVDPPQTRPAPQPAAVSERVRDVVSESAGDRAGRDVAVPSARSAAVPGERRPAEDVGESAAAPVWAGREQAWTVEPRWKDLVGVGRRIAEDLALPERKRLTAYLARLNQHEEQGTYEPAVAGEVVS